MNQKFLPHILTLFFVLGLLVSVGVVMAANMPQATLQTITVDTTVDELTDNGNCSLREAVQAANTGTAVDLCPAGSVTTTIMIPAGTYTLTIPGTFENENLTGDLDILSTVIIEGAGADVTVLNANGLDRFFSIHSNANADISGVTITGGYIYESSGGGILNYSTLNLHDAVVKNNEADTPPDATGGGLGGGVLNWRGTLVVTDVEINNNNAANSGGGIYVRSGAATIHNTLVQENQSDGTGGGIYNNAEEDDSSMAITDSSIISNTAAYNAGGIGNAFNTGQTATLSLDGVIVRGNSAVVGSNYLQGLGGGIGNAVILGASSGAGIVNISDSIISGNTATNGGGIGSTPATATGPVQMQVTIENSFIGANTASGTGSQVGNGGGILSLDGSLTVLNSTISGNQATGSGSELSGLGGGMLVGAQALPSSVNLVATTIYANSAALAGGGVANASLGGSADIQFKNMLIADNNDAVGAANCLNNGGTAISLGYNLDSGNSCAPIFIQPTDLVSTNPMLGNLDDDFVYPLLVGSFAIDSGHCTDHNGDPILEDQRWVPRPQGSACDIGAYEASSELDWMYDLEVENDSSAVPYGSVVTYTFMITNSGVLTAVNALFTDTLPVELDFVNWITQPAGSAVSGDEITWMGDLAVGEDVTIAFTAVHVGDYGDEVTNSIYLEDTAFYYEDSQTFTIVPRFYIYLPTIIK